MQKTQIFLFTLFFLILVPFFQKTLADEFPIEPEKRLPALLEQLKKETDQIKISLYYSFLAPLIKDHPELFYDEKNRTLLRSFFYCSAYDYNSAEYDLCLYRKEVIDKAFRSFGQNLTHEWGQRLRQIIEQNPVLPKNYDAKFELGSRLRSSTELLALLPLSEEKAMLHAELAMYVEHLDLDKEGPIFFGPRGLLKQEEAEQLAHSTKLKIIDTYLKSDLTFENKLRFISSLNILPSTELLNILLKGQIPLANIFSAFYEKFRGLLSKAHQFSGEELTPPDLDSFKFLLNFLFVEHKEMTEAELQKRDYLVYSLATDLELFLQTLPFPNAESEINLLNLFFTKKPPIWDSVTNLYLSKGLLIFRPQTLAALRTHLFTYVQTQNPRTATVDEDALHELNSTLGNLLVKLNVSSQATEVVYLTDKYSMSDPKACFKTPDDVEACLRSMKVLHGLAHLAKDKHEQILNYLALFKEKTQLPTDGTTNSEVRLRPKVAETFNEAILAIVDSWPFLSNEEQKASFQSLLNTIEALPSGSVPSSEFINQLKQLAIERPRFKNDLLHIERLLFARMSDSAYRKYFIDGRSIFHNSPFFAETMNEYLQTNPPFKIEMHPALAGTSAQLGIVDERLRELEIKGIKEMLKLSNQELSDSRTRFQLFSLIQGLALYPLTPEMRTLIDEIKARGLDKEIRSEITEGNDFLRNLTPEGQKLSVKRACETICTIYDQYQSLLLEKGQNRAGVDQIGVKSASLAMGGIFSLRARDYCRPIKKVASSILDIPQAASESVESGGLCQDETSPYPIHQKEFTKLFDYIQSLPFSFDSTTLYARSYALRYLHDLASKNLHDHQLLGRILIYRDNIQESLRRLLPHERLGETIDPGIKYYNNAYLVHALATSLVESDPRKLDLLPIKKLLSAIDPKNPQRAKYSTEHPQYDAPIGSASRLLLSYYGLSRYPESALSQVDLSTREVTQRLHQSLLNFADSSHLLAHKIGEGTVIVNSFFGSVATFHDPDLYHVAPYYFYPTILYAGEVIDQLKRQYSAQIKEGADQENAELAVKLKELDSSKEKINRSLTTIIGNDGLFIASENIGLSGMKGFSNFATALYLMDQFPQCKK